MILSDGTIRARLADGTIGIDPFDPVAVQPSAIDLRFADTFIVFDTHTLGAVDMTAPPAIPSRTIHVAGDDTFTLHVGAFALASTLEQVRLPTDLAALVEGKSSWGRYGLLVHATAPLIVPGFEGSITLELKNIGPWPLTIRPGMWAAQLAFLAVDRPVERPYGHPDLNSKYQHQAGPVASGG